MKQRDKQDLRTKSKNEIEKMVKDARNVLLGLKREFAQNKLKNTSQISLKRQELAVLLTILREKELIKNG